MPKVKCTCKNIASRIPVNGVLHHEPKCDLRIKQRLDEAKKALNSKPEWRG